MADKTIPSLDTASSLNNGDYYIVEQNSGGTKKVTYETLSADLGERILGTANYHGGPVDGETITGAITELNKLVSYSINNNSTLIHNSLGRGANITKTVNGVPGVSTDQWTEIKNGRFRDMYIGDYWLINDITYRIAAFDYYYGKNSVSAHHVVIVPAQTLITQIRLAADNVTTGGYIASEMHTTTLPSYEDTINTAFGSSHILSHPVLMSSGADANGVITGYTSVNVKLSLMTVQNVLGVSVNQANTTDVVYCDDVIQFPIFRLFPQFTKAANSSSRFWTRDIIQNGSYALIMQTGTVGRRQPSNPTSAGIRPAFCIYST